MATFTHNLSMFSFELVEREREEEVNFLLQENHVNS